MDLGVFEQVAAVLVVCVVAGGLAVLLRQPLIVGLIAAGIAVGPEVLGLVEATSEIELLATIGISLLLFVVGLKLDVRLVRKLGPVALATGLGQVVFTSVIGFGLAVALGFETVTAIYIAVALTFSSTIIVVKLLADKRELTHLHGRIAVGFLIVQDMVVILAMIAVTAAGDIGGGATAGLAGRVAGVGARGVALLGLAVVVGRYVAPRLTKLVLHHGELLVLVAITWAVVLSACSVLLGFTEEVGAFLAGVSLASTPYRDAVAGQLATLRDFLLVFFFIDLGSRFELGGATAHPLAVLVLSLFVLVGNPIIVMAIMGALGYRRRVSFKAGLTVAQISEFSLVFVALGVQQGHIGNEVLGLVTIIGLVTIAASTELMNGSDRLFAPLAPALKVFERSRPRAQLERADARPSPEHIVIGVGRLGTTLLEDLLAAGDDALGVDFDHRGIKRDRWHLPVIYGDADDPALPSQLPLDHVRWVISTLDHTTTNLHLLSALREHGYRGSIAVTADDLATCERLHAAGANVTIRPLHLAASPMISAILDRDPTPTSTEDDT